MKHINRSLELNSLARNTPENSSNFGVSILSNEQSPHADEISGCSTFHTGLVPHLLLHKAGTNFTPWFGEAVTDKKVIVLFYCILY